MTAELQGYLGNRGASGAAPPVGNPHGPPGPGGGGAQGRLPGLGHRSRPARGAGDPRGASAAFPDHGVLGEEEGERPSDSGYRWLVDPLDGTTNYAHGLPPFAVSLPWKGKGRGCWWASCTCRRWAKRTTAVRGGGAYCNGRRLHVSARERLDDCLMVSGFPNDVSPGRPNNLDDWKPSCGDPGHAASWAQRPWTWPTWRPVSWTAYWDLDNTAWDVAAGALLVTEAGAVTDMAGGQLDLYRPRILASNGRIHEQLLGCCGLAAWTYGERLSFGQREVQPMLRGGQLTGQVAIVTGAARGIGRAIALALAQEGAAVVVNYRVHAEAAEQVVQAIRAMGSDAVAVQADVTCPHAARVAGAGCAGPLGPGGHPGQQRRRRPVPAALGHVGGEWDAIMAVHLRGAFNCTQAVLPHDCRGSPGRIINISSVWGQVGAANEVAYSTAKAGLIGFTRALAKEVGRAGITVNAVAPGAIETDMLNGLSAAERAELAADIPLSRLGQPADAPARWCFLASPAASYVTGQVISPNGGMAM